MKSYKSPMKDKGESGFFESKLQYTVEDGKRENNTWLLEVKPGTDILVVP